MDNNEQGERIQQLIDDITAQLALLQQLVHEYVPVEGSSVINRKAEAVGSTGEDRKGAIVEGVFDGQNMVGPDGKIYTIPANYASKSKLLEGDILKLTITGDGSFIYKQIGPVERIRQVGTLVQDDSGNYRVVVGKGKSFRLLTASVTYYKGQPGDQAVILVPKEMDSRWATVENVVPAGEDVEDYMDEDEDGEPIILHNTIEFGGDEGELPSAHGELDDGSDFLLGGPVARSDD